MRPRGRSTYGIQRPSAALVLEHGLHFYTWAHAGTTGLDTRR
jgi:hypothetical protein